MSTPIHALLLYMKALAILLGGLAVVGGVVSRSYIFYESYVHHTVKREEEGWLRQMCREPEFYSNMRQHTDVCAQIEHSAQTWIFLTALNTVFTTAHVCGPKPCAEYINTLIIRGLAWPAAVVLGILAMSVPSLLTSMVRNTLWRTFDTRARGGGGGGGAGGWGQAKNHHNHQYYRHPLQQQCFLGAPAPAQGGRGNYFGGPDECSSSSYTSSYYDSNMVAGNHDDAQLGGGEGAAALAVVEGGWDEGGWDGMDGGGGGGGGEATLKRRGGWFTLLESDRERCC